MSKQLQLIACRAVSNDALKDGKLPNRIKVLDWGVSQVCDGTTVTLDQKSVEKFDANQRKTGRARVALDYNHSTVRGTEAHKEFGDKPTIFAYGTPRIIPGDGLWLENLEWTPFGEKYAKNCEDISPAPLLKNGRVIGLDSVALTPNGAIDGLNFYSVEPLKNALIGCYSSLTAYAMNRTIDQERVKPVSHKEPDDTTKPTASPMAAAEKISGAKLTSVEAPPAFVGQPKPYEDLSMEVKAHIAKFRADLGLPETMSDEDVMDRVRAKLDESMKPKQPNLSDHEGAGQAELEKGNIPTSQSNPHATITYSAVEKMVADAVAKLAPAAPAGPSEADQKKALLEQAAKDGKVVPLSAPEDITATPVSVLKKLIDSLPATVPMTPKVRPFSADDNKSDRSTAVKATKSAWAKACA